MIIEIIGYTVQTLQMEKSKGRGKWNVRLCQNEWSNQYWEIEGDTFS